MIAEQIDGPLCFVLAPTGVDRVAQGSDIDFDRVYTQVLEPAVRRAGMSPIRGDLALLGDPGHPALSEQFLLCDYAVAELTCPDSNVVYLVGVREGLGRRTLGVFAAGSDVLLDVGSLQAVAYSPAAGASADSEEDIGRISGALEMCRQATLDEAAVRLVAGLEPPPVSHLKTDLFRDEVEYSETVKSDLARARETGTAEAVDRVRARLGDVEALEAGSAIDLLLSYRAVGAWEAMIELIDRFAPPLAQSALVREQRGLALNRAGSGEEAERVLKGVIADRGASSETYALLGRVYKDRWDRAGSSGDERDALLRQAIDAYRRGFEADWRDAYPGINAVTLMELVEPPDPDQALLLPVVRYSVLARLSADPNYWDHATLLELAVLGRNQAEARRHLEDVLAAIEEPWQPETTANNLELIEKTRAARGEDVEWLDEIVNRLRSRA